MLCICGLGNPGLEYEKTRHNMGFIVLDVLRDEFNFPEFKKKFSGCISEGYIQGKKVILFKPMVYMNNSGLPITLLCNYYKISPENFLVIYDELELNFGEIKIKKAAGNAGHNGIRSIDAAIGKDYWRFKIGIGRPDHNDIAKYVLSDFSNEQELQKVLDNIRLNAHLLLEDNKDVLIKNYQKPKN